MVDAVSGGDLVNKTLEAARQLISNVAKNAQQFGMRMDGATNDMRIRIQLAKVNKKNLYIKGGKINYIFVCRNIMYRCKVMYLNLLLLIFTQNHYI